MAQCGSGLNRFVHDGMNCNSNVNVNIKNRSENVNERGYKKMVLKAFQQLLHNIHLKNAQ